MSSFGQLVYTAMDRAVQEAIKHHHLMGRSVPIFRDNQIVYLRPDGSTTPVRDNPHD